MKNFLRFNGGGVKFLIIILTATILVSCSEESQITSPNSISENTPTPLTKKKKNVKQWPSVVYDSTYGKIEMDYTGPGGIQPDAYQCGTKTTWGWLLVDFLPKPGKTVGIWPVDYSTSNLTTLRSHWGYTKLYIGNSQTQYNNAMAAHYTSSSIMVGVTTIPDANRYGVISNFGDVYAYYVDEPTDQNHSMGGVQSAINSLGLNSLFVISGYKRTDA